MRSTVFWRLGIRPCHLFEIRDKNKTLFSNHGPEFWTQEWESVSHYSPEDAVLSGGRMHLLWIYGCVGQTDGLSFCLPHPFFAPFPTFVIFCSLFQTGFVQVRMLEQNWTNPLGAGPVLWCIYISSVVYLHKKPSVHELAAIPQPHVPI